MYVLCLSAVENQNTITAGVFLTCHCLVASVPSLMLSVFAEVDLLTQSWWGHSAIAQNDLVILPCYLDCHWQLTNWYVKIRLYPGDVCVHVRVMTAVFAWYQLLAKNLIHRICYCSECFFFNLSKQGTDVWGCILLPCSARDGLPWLEICVLHFNWSRAIKNISLGGKGRREEKRIWK